MPYVNLKITSQVDVNNYAVEVRLDMLGVLQSVNDDGSDIYFLDENDQPLYYAVWLIRKDKNYGSVFVQLTLQANTPRTIKMYYGGENPYSAYHRPDIVFTLYDDFTELDTNKWVVGAGSPTIVNGHLRLLGSTNDTVKTVQSFDNVEVRVYYYYASIGTYGVRFAIHTRRQDNTYYSYMNEQGASRSGGYFRIVKTITGSSTVLADGPRTTLYSTGVYYEEVYRCVGSSLKWNVQGYMDNKSLLSATDTSIGAPGQVVMVTWDTGNDVRVDKIMIKYAVDPEPTVESTAQTPPSTPPSINPPSMVYSIVGVQGLAEEQIFNPPLMSYSIISVQGTEEELPPSPTPPPPSQPPSLETLLLSLLRLLIILLLLILLIIMVRESEGQI